MNVLAFDTCLGAVSVAVRQRDAHGHVVSREAYEERASGHAERLMPMIAAVMESAGADFSGIERIAVTVGPGSFTGTRVGIAAARALALATARPVVGATSLVVMAREAEHQLGRVCPERALAIATDAHRGMLYFQLFGDGLRAMSAPLLIAPHEAPALVGTQPLVAVGSGATALARAIEAAGGRAQAALPGLQPHARSLALLAGDLHPVSTIEPLYLRAPDVRPQGDKSLPRVAS